MRKIITIILALFMLSSKFLNINILAENSTQTIDHLTFTEYDTYCEVTNCDKYTTDEIIIPSSVYFNGKSLPVIKIGDNAFYDCPNLTSVILPNSITSIGKNAFFNCNKLSYIIIPNSVITICDNAFRDCSNLSRITIPASVSIIGNGAFYNNNSLSNIFYIGGQDDWEKISIGNYNSILSFTSITFISEYDNGLYFKISDKECAVVGCDVNISGNVEIPTHIVKNYNEYPITTIEENAFLDCKLILSIKIPDSVTKIGTNAFCGCISMTKIILGNGVLEICAGAFSGCDMLQYNEYKNGLYLGNENNNYLVLIKAMDKSVKSFEIHKNTVIVYDQALSDCSKLLGIKINDGNIKTIGKKSFFKLFFVKVYNFTR